MLSWPTKLPPSSIGESMPKFNPESGPRSDGGGVPDRGNPSPKPLPDYAPDTLTSWRPGASFFRGIFSLFIIEQLN
ncbi:hypothetical protein Hanom_Chr05g00451251 [Helianthus anomalus]